MTNRGNAGALLPGVSFNLVRQDDSLGAVSFNLAREAILSAASRPTWPTARRARFDADWADSVQTTGYRPLPTGMIA
jgi:hypothetical protein